MKSHLLLIIFSLLGLASQGSWANGQCTKRDLDQVESMTLVFQDWADLYKSYTKFKQCDSGGDISEGYSEAVVRLLADHWDKLDQFVSLSKKTKFKAFVLRHIDATTSDNDLVLIAHRAEAECTSHARQLCIEIGAQARAAIQESAR
jgi:hypothetical protein